MGNDSIVFLQVGVAASLLLWFLTRMALPKAALARVLRTPALLVPAAMVAVGAAIAVACDVGVAFVELPPLRFVDDLPLAGASLLGFSAIAMGIAGQIGLLEALDEGRIVGSEAFLAGVRRHFATVVLAKAVAAVASQALYLSFGVVPPPILVIWLIPMLFVAPIVGVATRHPKRPLRALVEGLRFASANIGRIGGPVLAHALFLLGLGIARVEFDGLALTPHEVALTASPVGYNLFPHVLVADSPPAAVLASLASAFASTVFLCAHWLGVRHGYDADDSAPLGAGPATPRA